MTDGNPYTAAIPEPVQEALARCDQLPARPGVAAAILKLAQDPSATLVHFAETVSDDAQIEDTLLRLANSLVYGRGREADNPRQAISLLGLNETLNLSLSVSLLKSLRRPPAGAQLNYSLFWRRALTTAAAARHVAERVPKIDPADAFLAGLLCNSGMIVIDTAYPSVYRDCSQPDHLETRRKEAAKLGADHSIVGAWLLIEWGLSEEIAKGVAGHHAEEALTQLEDGPTLSGILATAEAVTDIFWDKASVVMVEELSRLAYQSLGIGTATLTRLLGSVLEETVQTAQVFGINLGNADRLDEALSSAVGELEGLGQIADLKRETAGTVPRPRPVRRDDTFEALHPTLRAEFELARRQGWPLTVIYMQPKQDDPPGELTDALYLQLVANTRESDFVARYGASGSLAVLPAYSEDAARYVVRRVFDVTPRSHFVVKTSSLNKETGYSSLEELIESVVCSEEVA